MVDLSWRNCRWLRVVRHRLGCGMGMQVVTVMQGEEYIVVGVALLGAK